MPTKANLLVLKQRKIPIDSIDFILGGKGMEAIMSQNFNLRKEQGVIFIFPKLDKLFTVNTNNEGHQFERFIKGEKLEGKHDLI